MEPLRKVSAIPLAGCLLFLLPFITFSCLGQDLASVSGLNLATGTLVEMPGGDGNPQSQELPAEPLALLAFACGAAAGILGLLLRSRGAALVPAILSGAATVALLLLKSKIDGEVLANGEGMVQVSYTWAFWLAVGCYAAGGVFNGIQSRRQSPSIAADGIPWPRTGTVNDARSP